MPSPEAIQAWLTAASFLVFITIYLVNSRSAAKILAVRLETIDATMEDFKKEMAKLSDVIIKQALQDQRVSTMDERLLAGGKRMDELQKMVLSLMTGRKLDTTGK